MEERPASEPAWTDEQEAAALYCAETLRALVKLDPALSQQLLHTRGANAVAHAVEAGLFKHIDEP